MLSLLHSTNVSGKEHNNITNQNTEDSREPSPSSYENAYLRHGLPYSARIQSSFGQNESNMCISNIIGAPVEQEGQRIVLQMSRAPLALACTRVLLMSKIACYTGNIRWWFCDAVNCLAVLCFLMPKLLCPQAPSEAQLSVSKP